MLLTGPSSQTIAAIGRERRDNAEDHQHPLVLVLGPGENARLAPRVHHHVQNQDEERPGSDIPGDQEPRRFADLDPEAAKRHRPRPSAPLPQADAADGRTWPETRRGLGLRPSRVSAEAAPGRSGCLVGSWPGRRLGHAKAIRVQKTACLARGGGKGQAALTALALSVLERAMRRGDRAHDAPFRPALTGASRW